MIDLSHIDAMDDFEGMWKKHECNDAFDYDDDAVVAVENNDVQGEIDRVAVCVTGQMSRLELETKSKLFRSMKNQHVHVTALFVLYEGTSDAASPTHARHFERSPYKDPSSVRRFLTRSVGLSESNVEFRFVEPRTAPLILESHVRHLDHGWKGVEIQTKRALSHVRQWILYSECYDAVLASEKRQGDQFDAIVRIREDLYVLDSVKWSKIREMIRNNVDVVTPGYETYGGTNDKIAFVARRAARAFLNRPIEWYYHHSDRIWNETLRSTLSPEAILRRFQELSGLTGRTVSRSVLAVKTTSLINEGIVPAFDKKSGRFFREDRQCWLREFSDHNGVTVE